MKWKKKLWLKILEIEQLENTSGKTAEQDNLEITLTEVEISDRIGVVVEM